MKFSGRSETLLFSQVSLDIKKQMAVVLWGPVNKQPDFDGTIFMQDTGHILFDAHGCGPKRREELDEEIKNGVRSFRDVSEEMWGSLNVPFDDGFDIMKTSLDIDPAFHDFHNFCIKNNIPFNVISAGLKPILRRVLDEFLGKKQVRTPVVRWLEKAILGVSG